MASKKKRERAEGREVLVVPFDDSLSEDTFVDAYRASGGLCILRRKTAVSHALSLEWLARLYTELEDDLASFTVENARDTTGKGSAAFLSPSKEARGYCSFIVQKDEAALRQLLEISPFPELPLTSELSYTGAVWVFIARNGIKEAALAGRPPHTDSVQHDGTFHLQAVGTKQWTVSSPEHGSYVVTVQPGDLFVIDTKTWMHATQIDPQSEGVSISLARDFYLPGHAAEEEEDVANLTNVDGPYAVENIEAGTLLFRAEEHPDLRLGRSTEPNCELVEMENDQLAVVSTRDIAPGEFFCVAHSEDEDD